MVGAQRATVGDQQHRPTVNSPVVSTWMDNGVLRTSAGSITMPTASGSCIAIPAGRSTRMLNWTGSCRALHDELAEPCAEGTHMLIDHLRRQAYPLGDIEPDQRQRQTRSENLLCCLRIYVQIGTSPPV